MAWTARNLSTETLVGTTILGRADVLVFAAGFLAAHALVATAAVARARVIGPARQGARSSDPERDHARAQGAGIEPERRGGVASPVDLPGARLEHAPDARALDLVQAREQLGAAIEASGDGRGPRA